MFDHFIKTGKSAKGNVMTPLTYGTIIMETLGAYVATSNPDDYFLKYCAFLFCIGWGVFYGKMYYMWSQKDPNRLQSESYNLKSQAMVLGRESVGREIREIRNELSNSELSSSNVNSEIANQISNNEI